MRNINRKTHIRKMKPITQPNKRKRNNMMSHEFLKILARFFQHKHEYNRLLRPITRLQQIICLENSFVRFVGKLFVESFGAEIPYRRPAHDVQPEWTEYREIDRRVVLLHKPRLLRSRSDSVPYRNRPDHALHQKLAREAEKYGIKRHKREVARALSVLDWRVGISGGRVAGNRV